jgi:hypothetical protein
VWPPNKPGEGEPLFRKSQMTRQRRAVAQMPCTMCGEYAPPDDRSHLQQVKPVRFNLSELASTTSRTVILWTTDRIRPCRFLVLAMRFTQPASTLPVSNCRRRK